MVNKKLHVQGMSCGHCVSAIENHVGQLAGVEKVSVDLSNGKVDVTFDDAQVDLDKIIDVIDDQGYDVVS
ncbi:copper chaperone CopZ [Bacillaceae bacterium SIJ1]|uniref:copper chaperone CopZ n=1 Tax=Litoribacterium kuwaitense TaxID=1398745 RepID=UPI0013EBEC14|nr:copper chaperone CopZ [Litoribacterium kuwaitense]NGP43999.1 copper chaperone CopZ [Litoribacterium kuwaitense]